MKASRKTKTLSTQTTIPSPPPKFSNGEIRLFRQTKLESIISKTALKEMPEMSSEMRNILNRNRFIEKGVIDCLNLKG